MDDNSTEKSTRKLSIPNWLKISCLVIAFALTAQLLIRYFKIPPEDPANMADVSEEVRHPLGIPTVWPEIMIRIVGVARIDANTLIAEWAYINHSPDLNDLFSWGERQPNFVGLTAIVDNRGNEYPVAVNQDGLQICSTTNDRDHSEKSKSVSGGRHLSAWAQFSVPETATEPYRVRLYGSDHASDNAIKVPVIRNIDEQFSRAYSPKSTNWPDITIKLVSVERSKERDDEITVRWKYQNMNTEKGFTWGLDQPNFVARTEIFDYSNGTYHNIARDAQNGRSVDLCSSTNRNTESDWSLTIPAAGEIPASATFRNINGRNIQILFHSAMPVFYRQENTKTVRLAN